MEKGTRQLEKEEEHEITERIDMERKQNRRGNEECMMTVRQEREREREKGGNTEKEAHKR